MEYLSLSRINLEFAVFAAACLGLFACLHAGLWKRRLHWAVTGGAWLLLVVFLVAGKVAMHWAHERQRQQMESLVAGYAPTFAEEMTQHGHARVTINTPPDDPDYLELVNMQRFWVSRNPAISDIYTFRLDPVSGGYRYVVDAETDFNRNGIYEGEREQRTVIGETFPGHEEEIEQAMSTGRPTMERVDEEDRDPDRWGRFVSAYAPVLDASGRVEAMVGVDFESEPWFRALRMARYTMLCLMGFVVLVEAGGVSVFAVFALNDENRRRRREMHSEREARQKFATLVNGIDGVVFEWDPHRHSFVYMSDQVQRILGYAAGGFTSDPGFWRSKVPPEDCASVMAARAETVQTGEPCRVEYRMTSAGGRKLWLRELGSPCMDETGRVTLIRGVLLDITAQRAAAAELEELHARVVESSRRAGMAEVATGVLHNVGNVLNSVNVSAGLVREKLRESRLPNLSRITEILHREERNLGDFLTKDERGRMVPRYLEQLAAHLTAERQAMLNETENLLRGVEHIRGIVSAQQRHASPSLVAAERITPSDLMREARRLAAKELQMRSATVIEQFSRVPEIITDRHRLLQILLNLLQNAAQAVSGNAPGLPRTVTLSIQRAGRGQIRFVVSDTGMGIAAENLASIFNHGFTTRRDGHGFGLHSSALAAQEMGGSLTAHSHGPGMGAVFTLTLPCGLPDRRILRRSSSNTPHTLTAYAQP